MTNTILLDQQNNYCDTNGNLPERNEFDKDLLTAFCNGKTISQEGYDMLPPSIRQIVKVTEDPDEIDCAITIPEINDLSDILIVSRGSTTLKNGKPFRLDDFQLITKQPQIEIYSKI